MKKIAVIGGGAAGLMAAGTAYQSGAEVVLFEKNKKLGRKLAITGKGRCNVTNACSENEFLSNVVTNPRFLYSAINAFSSEDTQSFFEGRGVRLKVERGNRVFPVSDRAYDIVDSLGSYASKVKIIHERVTEVKVAPEGITGVTAGGAFYPADAVIVCTGGVSYPLTGSDGDGYCFAEKLGHTVIPPRPALVPIDTFERYDLAGLSLKNVKLTLSLNGKKVYSELGEMLFTHTGISGPLVLTASSYMNKAAVSDYKISIDLKPALDSGTLDRRLLSDFEKYSHKNFDNSLGDLLPIRLIPVIIKLSGIDEKKKVYEITKEERARLLEILKDFPLSPKEFRPIDEAIVTSGGVSVKEIDPRTMESKKIPGLYFAGEIIDVDALTGGFNLQIAFSTAYLAAQSACEEY